MPQICYNSRETKFNLVVRHIRLSSKTVVIASLPSAVYADTPPKSLVVKRPDFYYYFTTNDVRNLLKLAAFCSFHPALPNW